MNQSAKPDQASGRDRALVVFAKWWTPGQVKTRLAATLGDSIAAEVYRVFVETTLARFLVLPAHKLLAFAPAEAKNNFSAATTGWQLLDQGPGDLGQRMQRCFDQLFSAGYQRVVVLGSDSPHLQLSLIKQAFDSLDSNDAVFGPTEDGGYYLVGAAERTPPVFSDIPWSTPAVWQVTQATLLQMQTVYATLPSCYDIDNADDLQRLLDEVEQSPGDEALCAMAARVRTLLPAGKFGASPTSRILGQ